MDRRAFIGTVTGGLLAAPLAAEAQQSGKTYRIGFLGDFVAQTNPAPSFRQGLHDLGYVEGRDFVMEYRWAERHLDRLPELAADLVRAKVDVIVTSGTPGIRAAKQATQTIPIVFASGYDVVGRGIVESLARPGGNATGLSFGVEAGKGVQLLKEAVPTIVRVGYLYDPGVAALNPRSGAAAQELNLILQPIPARDRNDVVRALAELPPGRNGLVIVNTSFLVETSNQVCGLAMQRKLPAIGTGRVFAEAGCLMSFGENLKEMYRRAAWFVDKILKGAKPADLPVEQPTKIELIINLKTAKALGLTIPPALLHRADQVIE
jgi:putative tryptophan/tyrosine transport system substrate-binding protein